MTKCKMLLCAAVLAVAGAIVLFNRDTGNPPQPQNPEVAKPSSIAAAQSVQQIVASATPAVSTTNQTPTARGTLPYVLTSKVPFNKPLRLVAESAGAKTVGLVSHNSLLIEADEAARARLAADSRFEAISEFAPSGKIQPALAAMIADGAKSVDVSLVALAAEDRQIVISCLKAGGGEMLKGCLNEGTTIRATLPADLVATLALRGDVRWMEKFVRPEMTNSRAVEPEAMNVIPVWDAHGLSGAGQFVSTSDSGIDTGDPATLHRDLRDRVLEMKVVDDCDNFDGNGHGTHTAGSIVGTGAESDGLYRGTAWGAHLYVWFCGAGGGRSVHTPPTCAELFCGNADGTAWTNYIHSASWGGNSAGEYTTQCLLFDDYLWKHPDYLPVVSAGNAGAGRFTVGSPAAAKNVLAVGATWNLSKGDPSVTATFSSRGPCKDGRIKPDIAAPGDPVTSCRSSKTSGSGFYTSMSGTSMSCPLTAGSVALVRQWLVEKMGFEDEDGKRPTAALMKAVITGGAKGAATPNEDQGWGRVDLEETLFPSNRAVKLVDRIPFEQDFVTNIVIETTNAAPLDVQLVWVDFPGGTTVQSAPKLVNDLDLTVEARVPGEPTVRYGNGGDVPDTLNNVESVRIANAQPAKYVIRVNCKRILYGHLDEEGKPQGAAALYIRGAFNPDAKVDEPEYVHLKKQDKSFMSLDRALAAVKDDGETVEVLDWVNFDNSMTLTNACTIVATNADAAASYVVPQNGARIMVADGATVTMSNIVFAAADQAKTVVVATNGVLQVGSGCRVGAVETALKDSLVIVSELTEPLYVDCTNAVGRGDTFAIGNLDFETAQACANMLLHYTNTRMGGWAVDAGGTVAFQWERGTPVPRSAAAGQLNGVNYRALSDILEDYDRSADTEIAVFKDSAFTNDVAPQANLVMRGEGDSRPVLSAASSSGFLLEVGGSLTVSNLVFSGFMDDPALQDGRGFIYVNGGDLTLDDGAMLGGMTGNVPGGSGIIDLVAGVATMHKGAAIVNCSAEGGVDGNGSGGAICTWDYDGGTLNLEGGVIENCYASGYGGGVYVNDYYGESAVVNLSGELTVANNWSDNNVMGDDDICLYTSRVLPNFRLTGLLTNSCVGVWIGMSIKEESEQGIDINGVGRPFATNAVGVVDETTLSSFRNDATNAPLVAAVGEGGMLVWAQNVDPGTCEPDVAAAHVYYLEGGEAHYANLVTAIKYMTAGTKARIVMYKEGQSGEDIAEDAAFPANCQITLMSSGTVSYAFTRIGDVGLSVPAGSSLTLTNVAFGVGAHNQATKPYVMVDGGSLTLAAGAKLSSGTGNTNRDANGIAVYKGGTFAMLSGSKVHDCYSSWNKDKWTPETSTQDYAVGGGVLIDDGSTAYLRGGEITGCHAPRGGGLYACNGSKVYVSGDVKIRNNGWIPRSGGSGGPSNLLVEDLAVLYVDGELTGGIGSGDFICWQGDTNLIGRVDASWEWAVGPLTNSAVKFEHDILTGVRGVAASNETETVFLWSVAVQNGVYTNASGIGYSLVVETPAPEPEPEPSYEVVTNTPTAIAFKSVVCTNGICTLTLTNLVSGADYALFATNALVGEFREFEGVKPLTNFTAEADGPCELIVPILSSPVFWRATAKETVTTNYCDK